MLRKIRLKLGRRRRVRLFVLVLACGAAACAEPRIRRVIPPGSGPVSAAELWVEPTDITRRDLFWGPGGRKLAPENGGPYRFKEEKVGGYSPGFTVTDAAGREWSAKQGPEAQTEVVASRIYWAVGFHQPPTYFVPEWNLVGGGPSEGKQNSARFRPDVGKVVGEWSLHQNPFVGTQPYRGMLVLTIILNNWDIKPQQNKIYEFDEPHEGVRRWFVARDLGATFGRPQWPDGSRSNPEHFEAHPFILGFDGDRPRFANQGRHDELLQQIRRRDIRWMSERLARISDPQLADAFKAGGYPDDVAARFIRRLKEKIADGLAVCPKGC